MASKRKASVERKTKVITPRNLNLAWIRYRNFFDEPPHGTRKQMAALIALVREDEAYDSPDDLRPLTAREKGSR